MGFIFEDLYLKCTGDTWIDRENRAYLSAVWNSKKLSKCSSNLLRDKRAPGWAVTLSLQLCDIRGEAAAPLHCLLCSCKRRAWSWRVVNKIFRKALAWPAWQRGLIGFLSVRGGRTGQLGLARDKDFLKKGRAGDRCQHGFSSLNTYKRVDIIASSGFITFLCFLQFTCVSSAQNGPSSHYDV